ncbi:MAG: hypothetical protein K2X06_16335 [Burkholderiales bacterium]|nr:hypothetical protein [Burkholderiales bacterium]
MTAGARYLSVLLAIAGLALALILGLNLALNARALGGAEALQLASAWQQQTRGVTYAPPITASRRFKALRLAERLPDINAVAFGSSTAWGITTDALPAQYRLYNIASTGNPLTSIIGEIEYLQQHHPGRLQWMVVPLEWAIGGLYDRTPPPARDLAPAAVLAEAVQSSVSPYRRLQDALSYPKVLNLVKTLQTIAGGPQPLAAARSLFFDVAGAPYRCADGALARDFDAVKLGQCAGFRHDGSWSFGGEKRLTVAQAAALSRAAAAHSSKYSRALCATGGEPNPEYLSRLERAARNIRQSGGDLLFILPPLVPGLEQTMTADPANRACLMRTRQALQEWAQRIGATVLDAGRAERYGCKAEEFLDEHHAYPECYRRVMDFYFRTQREGRALPGLLQP